MSKMSKLFTDIQLLLERGVSVQDIAKSLHITVDMVESVQATLASA
jgi:DNA-binding NarL/FixJ family response regulator